MVVIGLAVLALARPGDVAPALRFAGGGLLCGLAVILVALAYPTWVFFTGPEHYTASAITGNAFAVRSDLLGPLLPTSLERLVPSGWAAYGDKLTPFGDYSENGSYLGLPLLLLLAYLGARSWADRWIRFGTLMALMTFVLSLGSPLAIDGHPTRIPLPDALLGHVPLIDQLLPSRISLFTALFVGAVVALSLDRFRRTNPSRPTREASHVGDPDRGRTAQRLQRAVVLLVAAVATAALLPRWPNRTVSTDVPSYFTSSDVDRIPLGTVALTYPYATPLHAQPMVWQAVTGMRFSLTGGYALIPDARGVPTLFPSTLQPATVQHFFINEAGGVPFYASPPVADNATLVTDVRHFIHRYRIGVVLVDPATPNSKTVEQLVRRTLGRTPVARGGMDVWYDVQAASALTVPAS